MVFFGVMVFQARLITITVYENGIAWERGSSHVFTTWDNIDRIDRKDEGQSTTFGFFLREPLTPETNRWLDKRLFAAPVDYIRLIPTRSSPDEIWGQEGQPADQAGPRSNRLWAGRDALCAAFVGGITELSIRFSFRTVYSPHLTFTVLWHSFCAIFQELSQLDKD